MDIPPSSSFISVFFFFIFLQFSRRSSHLSYYYYITSEFELWRWGQIGGCHYGGGGRKKPLKGLFGITAAVCVYIPTSGFGLLGLSGPGSGPLAHSGLQNGGKISLCVLVVASSDQNKTFRGSVFWGDFFPQKNSAFSPHETILTFSLHLQHILLFRFLPTTMYYCIKA